MSRFWFGPVLFALITTSLTRPAAADTDAIRLAAQTYDAAVAHYSRAEYTEAAKLFLEADAIHPSADALSSAIAAARQANDHLLVARIALRAQAREESAPELAASARQALAEAEAYLSRVQLSCTPLPCELTLDDDPVSPGKHYVLPGLHRVTAHTSTQLHTASHELLTEAAASYRINLAIAPIEPAPPVAHAVLPAAPTSTQQDAQATEAPLPTGVFYASLAVTGVVTGLTVWSGLDALEQKRELADPPSQASRDHLVESVRRTDILLVTSVVLAATTAYIGWRLVDFGDDTVEVQVSEHGCSVAASGVFW